MKKETDLAGEAVWMIGNVDRSGGGKFTERVIGYRDCAGCRRVGFGDSGLVVSLLVLIVPVF